MTLYKQLPKCEISLRLPMCAVRWNAEITGDRQTKAKLHINVVCAFPECFLAKHCQTNQATSKPYPVLPFEFQWHTHALTLSHRLDVDFRLAKNLMWFRCGEDEAGSHQWFDANSITEADYLLEKTFVMLLLWQIDRLLLSIRTSHSHKRFIHSSIHCALVFSMSLLLLSNSLYNCHSLSLGRRFVSPSGIRLYWMCNQQTHSLTYLENHSFTSYRSVAICQHLKCDLANDKGYERK